MLGKVFVASAYVLIAGVGAVHFLRAVPFAADGSIGAKVGHYYLSTFLLVELLLHYSLAVWSDPGFVADAHVGKAEGSFCAECARVKPLRAHHCRVCRRCVFEMDHHCPWVNNCVGYRNYRHFWLLLLYLWLSCAYAAALAFGPFFEVVWAAEHRSIRPTSERLDRFALTVTFLTTATLGVTLLGYWLWHCFLLVTRRTTIEFAGGEPPYRPGRAVGAAVRVALQRMLGRRDRWWAVAMVVPPPPKTLPPPYVLANAAV